MKRTKALLIGVATVLTATAAHAERPTHEDIQAPRAQEQQAPRDRPDDVQAPRGQDESQAPRGRATALLARR
jgi:hypothetical protein